MMKLIVGYDGSECAELAIRDLAHAGLPQDVTATVLSVADLVIEVPYPHVSFAPAAVPEYVQNMRAQAQQAMTGMRETSAQGMKLIQSLYPDWEVHAEAVADSPYWALIKMAEHWRADLVVVGSHGRSCVGRLLLGSVSQFVLNHCPCSVRIGRGRIENAEPHRPLRIILGYDGSSDANLAVDAICGRRWPAHSVVQVVTALDQRTIAHFGGLQGWSSEANDESALASDQVEQALRRLRNAGLAAVPILQRSDPRHALLHQAETVGADCIFVGARGLTRLERFLVGSVSSTVGARAHCSVEIIRQPPWNQPAATNTAN